MENRISYSMDDETYNRIKAKIAELVAEMPFLIDLTQDEKKSLPKFGDRSVAFVNKTLEIAQQNPGVLPRSFDVNEMQKDVKLYSQLFSLTQILHVLMDKMEDTLLLAGVEAYSSALLAYRNFKANSELMDGADHILDELGRRFVQKNTTEVQPAVSAS